MRQLLGRVVVKCDGMGQGIDDVWENHGVGDRYGH